MDLREKKTLRAIRTAFLQLRGQRPLEKITVKELCELAEISKATFYIHYRDLYDLSDRLTDYLQDVDEKLKYKKWFFGHYHDNCNVSEKHILLYEQIVRIW